MKKSKKSKEKLILLKQLEFPSQAQLDFHDFGIINPFEIEKILSEFLEDCYIDKLHNVIVITGKGKVVRPLVQKVLKTSEFVDFFKVAGYHNGNEGAFEVTLKST